MEFYSPEYSRNEGKEVWTEETIQKYVGRALFPDPLKQRYVDPYSGLPVVISGNGQVSGPIHFKGYNGIIKSFNPNLQVAEVELNSTQRRVPIKLACLQF